jgi:hypothetical protein
MLWKVVISVSYFDNILRAENREAHCSEGTDPEVPKDEMCVDLLLSITALAFADTQT